MTVENLNTKTIITANGVQTVWPFTFVPLLPDGSDVKIVVTDTDGDETAITSNFTVNLSTSEVTYPTVVSGLPPVTLNYVVTMYRELTLTQALDLLRQGAFNADNVEAALDKITGILQQHEEKFTRTIQFPISTDPDDLDPDPFLNLVVAAKNAAEAAQALAETAQTNAEIAQTNAETAETNSETAQTAAEVAQAAAEAAVASLVAASQGEAEAGSENTKYTTSLRVKQAIDALSPVTLTNTATLTNKRVTQRVGSTTSSATPTINTDSYDVYKLTALAVDITSFTTNLSGTPTDGQKLIIRILDNGTARAITWGASFQDGTVALPLTTTISKTLMVGLIYDSVDAKWTCEATGSRA